MIQIIHSEQIGLFPLHSPSRRIISSTSTNRSQILTEINLKVEIKTRFTINLTESRKCGGMISMKFKTFSHNCSQFKELISQYYLILNNMLFKSQTIETLCKDHNDLLINLSSNEGLMEVFPAF